MKYKIKKKEGPRKITNPKIGKGLLKVVRKHFKEYSKIEKDIKILFYMLYKTYPNKWGVSWIETILPKEDIQSLIDNGVLVLSKDRAVLGLGSNGLALISMWNTEKMTKWIIGLTISAIILAASTIILTIISLF